MDKMYSAAEARLTFVQFQKLKELAARLSIEARPTVQDQDMACELSGEGFSGLEPIILPMTKACPRLLAEVCAALAPWIAFTPDTPCEVTLFGIGEDALDAAVRKFQYRLAMRLSEKRRDDRRAARRRLFPSLDAPKTLESSEPPAPVGTDAARPTLSLSPLAREA